MPVTFKEQPDAPESIERMLHPWVKKWFFSRFKEFSLPQRFGVLEIFSRRNILVSAPTGATKTLTAFLSILNQLVISADSGTLEARTYCVYISPLKALNYDIEVNLRQPLKEIEAIAGKKLGIRVGVRTGDTSAAQRQEMTRNAPHIFITTPESLAILLNSPKFSAHLLRAEWCVVDEVHALAENKRGTHLSLSLERLQRLSPGMCRIGLSATVAPLEDVAAFLAGLSGGAPRDCLIADVQFLKELDLKVISPVKDLINCTHDELQKRTYEVLHELLQQHRTTLVFTNTRSATERVVHHLKERYPQLYGEHNIGAHHSSLSKNIRRSLEDRLRNGELKCIVCSTSLELGIDIGFIDLVVLLGSPKSVARALQRCGRSGHRLHDTTKGRILVLNRDDLVECAVLLKSAIEHKIDRLHIPQNCLDVLAQHLYGIAIVEKIGIDELFALVQQSYCYRSLPMEELMSVVRYLAGEHVSLEERNVYAKIWYDPETRMIGRRGKMARVIYMTNIGTIPEETFIRVKLGELVIGTIEEAFLERLRMGDVFVLGGATYEFRHAQGMTAFVKTSVNRPPTVPSWFSEMLPLSFDLASEILRFRSLMEDKFEHGMSREEVLQFINSFLYVEGNAAEAIYLYMREQFDYSRIPTPRRMLVEHYKEEQDLYIVFHSLYGRRVNDCLSRAIGYIVSKQLGRDVELGITDTGFYLKPPKQPNLTGMLQVLKADRLDLLLAVALEKSEVLRRRFRHCATRSLMILRSYKGRAKSVGRQQLSSRLLLKAVERISKDFPILKEARREVLEDLMDISHAKEVVQRIESGDLALEESFTTVPSPFAFNIVLQGRTDMLKMEERQEFLRRMHQMVLAKIALEQGKRR